jgi:hypothetical protein
MLSTVCIGRGMGGVTEGFPAISAGEELGTGWGVRKNLGVARRNRRDCFEIGAAAPGRRKTPPAGVPFSTEAPFRKRFMPYRSALRTRPAALHSVSPTTTFKNLNMLQNLRRTTLAGCKLAGTRISVRWVWGESPLRAAWPWKCPLKSLRIQAGGEVSRRSDLPPNSLRGQLLKVHGVLPSLSHLGLALRRCLA